MSKLARIQDYVKEKTGVSFTMIFIVLSLMVVSVLVGYFSSPSVKESVEYLELNDKVVISLEQNDALTKQLQEKDLIIEKQNEIIKSQKQIAEDLYSMVEKLQAENASKLSQIDILKRDIDKLEMERKYLKEANDLLKRKVTSNSHIWD